MLQLLASIWDLGVPTMEIGVGTATTAVMIEAGMIETETGIDTITTDTIVAKIGTGTVTATTVTVNGTATLETGRTGALPALGVAIHPVAGAALVLPALQMGLNYGISAFKFKTVQ
ncbi:hypothetical protein FRC17_001969 [Serendipita sp. 399]|nr:hypothetical protein FRC17_001969 [Serendipita sp. 399]